MAVLWKDRTPPTPLEFDSFSKDSTASIKAPKSSIDYDFKAWKIQQCVVEFTSSIDAISKQFISCKKGDPKYSLSFDKDDEHSLTFVTAAANIRAFIFKIDAKSRSDVKEIAGNIIPAIATTNAIVAGMVTMLAIKALTNQLDKCQNTFVAYGGERAHLLLNDDAPKPNAQCGVCSTSYVGLKVDTTTFTLGNFLEKVLINSKRGLGLLGEIAIMLGDGLIYDVDFDENIDSSFSDLGINHGKQLMITNDHDEDESENKCVVVFISHDEHVKGFQISGDTRNLQSRPIAEKVLEKSDLKRKAEHVDLDDEVLVID